MAGHATEEASRFHHGLELFNSGEWFEAHEVWEDIWHEAKGRKKLFYQGLIQAAVTIEHIRRGNPRGVRSVFASCLSKFEGMHGVYMGVDIDRLRSAMQRYVDPILNLPGERFAPGESRGQTLPVDLAGAPKIELAYDPFEGNGDPSQTEG